MSGHSHFKSIKYRKAITDAKRGKIFSKLSRQISVAVKEKGSNPEMNPKLRLAIEEARSFNMPKDNIERAIKRGSGELEGAKLESVLFEAYGPGGIAIIVEGITDNKNRTLGEIKQVFNQNNGKLADSGSVKWMFERKGCITINSKSQISNFKNRGELELLAIEAGAEDIYWHDDVLDIYTKPEELEKVNKNLEEKGIQPESTTLDWVAKEQVELDQKQKEVCQKLFETLDENEAVQEIYSNLKI
jgi:YebC/PmpR family DNA-binding regulatory protein